MYVCARTHVCVCVCVCVCVHSQNNYTHPELSTHYPSLSEQPILLPSSAGGRGHPLRMTLRHFRHSKQTSQVTHLPTLPGNTPPHTPRQYSSPHSQAILLTIHQGEHTSHHSTHLPTLPGNTLHHTSRATHLLSLNTHVQAKTAQVHHIFKTNIQLFCNWI